MVHVEQAIVVEGRYDKNTLSQIVDTTIFQTNGFSVMHDRELLALLRRAAQTCGLVILTDSDGAGLVIRSFLRGALPREGVLHAYVPEIAGKEKRKAAPGKAGLLGVEGMTPEIILRALRDAGAEIDGEARTQSSTPITKADLYALGLSGQSDSAVRRKALQRALSLPEHLSANALLQALNLLFTREEFFTQYESESAPEA